MLSAIPEYEAALQACADDEQEYRLVGELTVTDALARLPTRLRFICQALDLDSYTPREVAELLGISRQRVLQLRQQAHAALAPLLQARLRPAAPQPTPAYKQAA